MNVFFNKTEPCYTIVCPCCKNKQTGVVRVATSPVTMILNASDPETPTQPIKLFPGTDYIRCSYLPCQAVLTGDDLEEVTRKSVRYPSDLL